MMANNNLLLEKEKIQWKDCKRWMGMPLSFTKYMVSEERLVTKVGFFSSITDEILLYRILDVRLRRSFGEKLFGVGTVTLISADPTHRELELKHIKKPDQVRRFLSRKVEAIRTQRGLVGREIIGAAGSMLYQHDQENCQDPNHDHLHVQVADESDFTAK